MEALPPALERDLPQGSGPLRALGPKVPVGVKCCFAAPPLKAIAGPGCDQAQGALGPPLPASRGPASELGCHLRC